ncbi:propanediol dehydratase, partial [Klebsiella pneumoniae]|nr:propanediol dehydratase [Klebsiella pneumoniae]
MQQTTQIQPSFTLKTREGGVASADERADEVVIGVGPAFDKHQHHTLIDMPHGAILKELIAGVEEEGLHARVVGGVGAGGGGLFGGGGGPPRGGGGGGGVAGGGGPRAPTR